jgi:putative DNA methylase
MTTTAPRKKLIEVSIPLEAINAASRKEKDVKVGKHTSLHQWFAPRPIATCRAVLFAQLVDDPSSWPDRYPTEEAQDIERRRLHRIIEDMVPWEASNNETILNAARWEIARSVAWGLGEEPPAQGDGKAIFDYLQNKAPPVYDPFSGGGSIPLEAQRLGLRAYGSDLNPVAVLIGKALVEIPPKFAGKPPVNPKSRAEISRGGKWNGKGAQGLAEDVRYYGQWMRDEAEKRIGHLYPKACLPDGSKATVIAWIWARTVRSPDPAAKGAMVPLASSYALSTKEGKKAWVELVVDAAACDGWRFEVKTGSLTKAQEEKLKAGTKTGRGSNFSCVLTGSSINGDHIKAEGAAGRIGTRLMAIVAEGNRRRVYLTPSHDHEVLAATAKPGWEPEGDLPNDPRNFWTVQYGLDTFASLFTPRQMTALTTLSDLVGDAREKALADAKTAHLPSSSRLSDGGTGAEAYADAMATYLAFVVNKNAQTLNSLVRWFPQGEKAQPIFERQSLPMNWDYAEANVLASSTGSLTNCTKYVAMSLERWGGTGIGIISHIAAQEITLEREAVICTDPPYYDNIGYADLSDFFYVWMRRSLNKVWPLLLRRLTSPKAEELVATPYRHGGASQAEAFFMNGMGLALSALRRASTDIDPLTIFYAFKQSEANADGISSAGWASFLQAIINSKLCIDGTWPVRTEHSSKMISQAGANLLSSSIVLVCRKRASEAATVTRADFIRALRRELPEAIDDIRRAGVGPVDMQQSVIGPGMGIFSRHAKVLEDDDSAMPVKTALSLINRVWEEIDQELDAAFDAETQVALAWFATYGFDARPSGELIMLANAKNIGTNALFVSGVFKDLKGKTALTPREELPKGWTPARDKSLTVWDCVQHTARVLNTEDGGGAAAGRLVAEMGPKAAEARALAYRLFEIATQKGWSAEALVYNELAQEWPKLEDIAASTAKPARPVQTDMFGAL